MDRVSKVLFDNFGISAMLIFGVYIPGLATFFIKRYEMFKELDIIKVSLLSFILALPSFVIILLVISIGYLIGLSFTKSKPEGINESIYLNSTLGNIMVFAIYIASTEPEAVRSQSQILKYAIPCAMFFLIIEVVQRKINKWTHRKNETNER